MGSGKPWGGRFEGSLDKFVEEFGASLPFDRRMWAEDILGSIAHAKMLAAQGMISEADRDAIESGLGEVYREIADGRFEFDNADEDVHMAIERRLIDIAGPAGGRLHTARSRNDQVALDTRMWSKRVSVELSLAANTLRSTLVRLSQEHLGAVMPGYTHLQKAQPVLLSHHLLAYQWMLARDVARFRVAWDSADAMPLGSAALAGTGFPVDREAVARSLGFARVSPNSLDAVSDRDFLLDLAYACSVCAIHLSRLAEEMVVWSTEEFGFVRMDDAFATGSSIMPQKKNPDVAELVRGKTGRVIGDLVTLLVALKGLPLAYNKDMQEDKPAAFDAADTVIDCLRATDGMLSTAQFDTEAMRRGALGGFMAATDLADYLVGKGVPFRESHEIVGRLVLECERHGRTLQDLAVDELRSHSEAFDEGALLAVDIDEVVRRRSSQGGTGHEAVESQLTEARISLDADTGWIEERSLD